MYYIYAITCENGHYYIGSSPNPESRFLDHLAGNGSKFTQKHKPVSYKILEETNRTKVYSLEHRWTEKYVLKYGFRNVRGGNWLSMREDCYTERTLFFMLGRLKKEIKSGSLGKIDYPVYSF